MNFVSRFSAAFRSRYFDRFPENWADKLGEKYEWR
jgi:hypothetical protein